MWQRLVRWLAGRRSSSWVDADIRAEIEAHISMRTEDNVAAGMTRAEARREAERRFGDARRILRQGRAERLGEPLLSRRGDGRWRDPFRDLVRDVRFGLRMMRKAPGFTAVAVTSLALGIGFNTTVFSVVDAVLLRPRNVHEPARLVRVVRVDADGPSNAISAPDLADLDAGVAAFSGVAGYRTELAPFNDDGRGEFLFGESVTDDLFDVLGVRPLLGRDFTESENLVAGSHFVAMISEELWRDRFGADPEILGRDIVLSGDPYTIVGVVPGSYEGGTPPVKMHFWVPLAMSDTLSSSTSKTSLMERRGQRSVTAVARLAPAVTVERAREEVQAFGQALAAEYADTHAGAGLDVLRYEDVRLDPQGDRMLVPAAGVLMGVVGLILLIACANVANMMLSRASVRRQEMSVRLALGAGRGRLIRQLLTESVLLALVGGALGALLADVTLRVALALQPPVMVPISFDVAVDTRVLAFTAALAALTGIVFGVAPALQSARQDVGAAMKAAEGRRTSGSAGSWLRGALVVVQIAVSLVLLIAAALLARSLASAEAIDPGFATEGIVTLSPGLRMQGYTPESARDLTRRYLERVASLPGVQAVTFAERIPLESSVKTPVQVWFPDRPLGSGQEPPEVAAAVVSPGYFDVLEIPIVAGRAFDDGDVAGSSPVGIVNPAFAERFWPGQTPLGKRVSTSGLDGDPIEIVGVTASHKIYTLGEDPVPYLYRPFAQNPGSGFGTIVARTTEPGPVLEGMRRQLLELDPNLAVMEAETIGQHMALSLFPVRAAAGCMALLGAIGAILAAVGVYGVVAFGVSRRTHEIGIRMAVGADRRRVLGLVVGQGLRLALLGVALGAVFGLAFTRALRGLLYGVGTTDPVAFATAAVLLLCVALVANLVPARRAVAVDPVTALRSE